MLYQHFWTGNDEQEKGPFRSLKKVKPGAHDPALTSAFQVEFLKVFPLGLYAGLAALRSGSRLSSYLLDSYGLYFSPNLTKVEWNVTGDMLVARDADRTVKTAPKRDSPRCKVTEEVVEIPLVPLCLGPSFQELVDYEEST